MPHEAWRDRTLMIVLAYLWLLALVPLLVQESDAEVRWHAKHGLVLTAAEFILLTAWMLVMSFIWIMTAGLLGCLFTLLTPLLLLAIVVLHVIAIARATSGHRLIIPGLSEYANRF